MSHAMFRKKMFGVRLMYADKRVEEFLWEKGRFRELPPGVLDCKTFGWLPPFEHSGHEYGGLTLFRIRMDERKIPKARSQELEEGLRQAQGTIEETTDQREERFEQMQQNDEKESRVSSKSFEVLVIGKAWLICNGADKGAEVTTELAKNMGVALSSSVPWVKRRFSMPSKYQGTKSQSRLLFGTVLIKNAIQKGIFQAIEEGGNVVTVSRGHNQDPVKKTYSGDIQDLVPGALGETISKIKVRHKIGEFSINSVNLGITGLSLGGIIEGDEVDRYTAIFEYVSALMQALDGIFEALWKQGAFDSFLRPGDLPDTKRDKFLAVYSVFGSKPGEGEEEGEALKDALKEAKISMARYLRMAQEEDEAKQEDAQPDMFG